MKTKNCKKLWGTLTAICMLTAIERVNAEHNNATATQDASSSGSNPLARVERAANLYGKQLLSADNQKVGKVQNLVLDLESERILYVVVDTGEDKVAIPPQLFGNTSGDNIRLKTNRQKVENAPKFTSEVNRPNQMGQASFVAQVYKHFGQNAWWQGSESANQGSFNNVHRLNQLIGTQVRNVSNQNVAKVNNVVVDMPSGRVMFVVLAPDARLNLGNNLYAMPSNNLTLSSDKKHLVSNIDQQKLASAPHFEKGNWPDLKDVSFASQVYQYYGKQPWFQTSDSSDLEPTGR